MGRTIARLALRAHDAGVAPEIVHGSAIGLDMIAHEIAHRAQIKVHPLPAAWREHADGWCRCPERTGTCKAAGHRRNQEMLDRFTPDRVFLFTDRIDNDQPGGGTGDMARRAIAFREPLDIMWFSHEHGWRILRRAADGPRLYGPMA